MYIFQDVKIGKGKWRVNSKGRPVDLPRLLSRGSTVDGGAGLAMSRAELAMSARFAAQDPAVDSPQLHLDAQFLDGQLSTFV